MREQIRLITSTTDIKDQTESFKRIAELDKKKYVIVESYINEDNQYFVLEKFEQQWYNLVIRFHCFTFHE